MADTKMLVSEIRKTIREVPDFPKPGINFYDITTLLADPTGFRLALDLMEDFVRSCRPDKLLAVESRGFFFAAGLADRLRLGMVPARKPGKLPYKTIALEYELEYGSSTLELHADAVREGERVVIVDDLIATGGTLWAASQMVENLGGVVAGISAVIDLTFLPWRDKLGQYTVNCLIAFDSE